MAGLLRDRSAAEEVTSAAFEKAWRKRRQIDPERGSAQDLALRHRPQRRARRASPPLAPRRPARRGLAPTRPAPAALVGPSGGDPAEVAISRTALRQAMASLNGRERELIALKFFAGLSNSEIAEVIGASETNAGTRIHRVIEKLRRSFDEAA